MKYIYTLMALVLLTGALAACNDQANSSKPADATPVAENKPSGGSLDPAAANISSTTMLDNIKKLASDEFEGRSPATKGEELTVKFLEDNFKSLGLKPGNPDGSYVQKVPLVNFKVDNTAQMQFSAGGKTISLKYGDEYVAWTRRLVNEINMDAELVFVGYGAVAPEYKWDDFKDVDVKGKVVVMLINDPPLPDEKMFGGKAMTYYGRWTYKFEEAKEKGAAGCIIIHETEPAGYPWEVVKNSWGSGGFTISDANNNMSLCPVESWMTFDKAKEVFNLAGKDLLELKKAALDANFKPIPLGVKASLKLKNQYSKIESNNVLAKLEGSDPTLKDEYVILTAHWDHFGIGEPVKGGTDKIYNGARDNASGTAGLLEIAKAFTKLATPPKRSILFLAVTAEERGLLGSAYYGQNPLYPMAKTVANLNMDSLNIWGRTKDFVIVGLGNSSLDDYVKKVAGIQGRTVKPDPEPEKGHFYRSDHFSFAKQGVPALDAGPGTDFIGKPADFGKTAAKKYVDEDYHKPSDEVRPDWDLSGAVEDLQLLFQVSYDVANATQLPTWNAGTEFKAKREESLKAAGK